MPSAATTRWTRTVTSRCAQSALGKFLKFDPYFEHVMLRQCDEDIFSCYDSDGSTIIDGHVQDFIWDHDAVRWLHMTTRGYQVPMLGAANQRRQEDS